MLVRGGFAAVLAGAVTRVAYVRGAHNRTVTVPQPQEVAA
jgi:hypothetical protein